MKLAECVKLMQKREINKILNHVLSDHEKDRNENNKEFIKRYINYLISINRIKDIFEYTCENRSLKTAKYEILYVILESKNNIVNYADITNLVKDRESDIINESRNEEAFTYTDKDSLEIYKVVLEAAYEDNEITSEEYHLLEKLRKKLSLTRHECKLLEASIGRYPIPDKDNSSNTVHSVKNIEEALKKLQEEGILYIYKLNNNYYIALPDEIKTPLKEVIDYELNKNSQRILYNKLKKNQLIKILTDQDIIAYGNKGELVNRIIKAGIKPSEALNGLNKSEIVEICESFGDIKISGNKPDKIKEIIDYCDNIRAEYTEDEENISDKKAYENLEDIAERKSEELRLAGLICKSEDIGRLFEKATNYIFMEIFNHDLINFNGNEHADGGIYLERGKKQLLLWDNKTKLKRYDFPKNDFDQFEKYIRTTYENDKRVSIFLIITRNISNENELKHKLHKLKNTHKESDTDVALISANDLKEIAETWAEINPDKKFDLYLFNRTGIIKKNEIIKRIK